MNPTCSRSPRVLRWIDVDSSTLPIQRQGVSWYFFPTTDRCRRSLVGVARSVRWLNQLTLRFHHSQVGTIHRALTLEDGTIAVTGNYLKIKIPPGRLRNEWIDVKICGVAPLSGAPVAAGR